MPLKGMLLAFLGYDRPEQRTLCDLDLLVRERDFVAVRESLETLGYRTTVPALPAAELPLYAHCAGQVRFASPRLPPLEIHFRLLNLGMPGPGEPAWEEARPGWLREVPILLPSPERLLLHLCLHAQQHAFGLLRLFVDIAVSCRRDPPRAELFAELARRHHLTTAALLAFGFAAELLPAFSQTGELADSLPPSPWRRALAHRLWHADRVRTLTVTRARREAELPLAFLLGEAPWRAKAAFLRYVAFPPTAWRVTAAGRSGRYRHLCHLLRVARAELRYGAAMPGERE